MTVTTAPAVDQHYDKVIGRDLMAMRAWLWVTIVLVLAMVVVGGATRLTDSGLSITEWQPVLGIIPPLSAADWQIAFDKYKEIPEYQLVNEGMSLAAFQYIYWWEWAHRFLGRIIGLVFALPLVAFWFRGSIPAGLKPWLLALLVLGAIQGFVGWYMVQSGLVDRIDVSPYRLALHLSIAFLILALLVRTVLRLDIPPDRSPTAAVSVHNLWLAGALCVLIFLQATIGGFVAGLKAGLTYNTWPLMDGELIPHGLLMLEPWWINFGENVTMVQFNHRMTAYLIVVLALVHVVALSLKTGYGALTQRSILLLAALLCQGLLGIWTLLASEGAVPIGLGLAHQGGAALVLIIAVWHLERLSQQMRAGESVQLAARHDKRQLR